MHPGRRSILVRWVGYIVVIAATVGWIYTQQMTPQPRASSVLKDMAPPAVDLPSEEVTRTIRDAITAASGRVAKFGSVERVEPSLVVLSPEEVREDGEPILPVYSISSIFLGPPKKFAVLNGMVLEEGEKVPDGRVLKTIDSEGVVLALGAAEQRIDWIPPYKVELTGPSGRTPRTDEVAGEATPAATGAVPGTDLENLPEDLSPEQALDILQQVGR